MMFINAFPPVHIQMYKDENHNIESFGSCVSSLLAGCTLVVVCRKSSWWQGWSQDSHPAAP